MKRLMALSLAVLLIFLCLAGCGQSNANRGSSTEAPTANQSADEPMVITWLARNQFNYYNVKDTECQLYVEERYNVKIDIVTTTDIGSAESINLYWASGNIPDVAVLNYDPHVKLAKQGLLRELKLDDLEKYAPDWMNTIYSFTDKDKVMMPQIMVDGKIYVLPWMDISSNQPFVMGARKDWMDNLGITAIPKTLDDLHDLLWAFTYDDPDGNKVNDTFGMHGGPNGFGYITGAFGIYPNAYYLQDDGNVVYTTTTEQYKELLKLLNSWFAEGIFDPEFATDTRDIQRQKWANGALGILVDHSWWFSPSLNVNVAKLLTDNDPDAEIVYLEPVEGPYGKFTYKYSVNTAGDGSYIFGKNCSDEKLYKILEILNDIGRDVDLYCRLNYGIEGEDWEFDEIGMVTRLQELDLEDGINRGIMYFYPSARPYEITTAHFLTPEDVKHYDPLYKFPTINMGSNFNSPVENDAFNTYSADITTAANEFYYSSIMGMNDIDADWDAFLKSLDGLGLQEILKNYNEAMK